MNFSCDNHSIYGKVYEYLQILIGLKISVKFLCDICVSIFNNDLSIFNVVLTSTLSEELLQGHCTIKSLLR